MAVIVEAILVGQLGPFSVEWSSARWSPPILQPHKLLGVDQDPDNLSVINS